MRGRSSDDPSDGELTLTIGVTSTTSTLVAALATGHLHDHINGRVLLHLYRQRAFECLQPGEFDLESIRPPE